MHYYVKKEFIIIPVSAILDRGVQADALAYFRRIPINTSMGAQIFPFRIVIDLTMFNNDLDVIFSGLFHNNLVEQIFKLSNGQNVKTFRVAAQGGIDAVNASHIFPEIRLIENRLVVYEDHVIYQQALPPDLELPVTFDFELLLIVIGQGSTIYEELLPFAVGTVVLTLPPGTYIFLFGYN